MLDLPQHLRSEHPIAIDVLAMMILMVSAAVVITGTIIIDHVNAAAIKVVLILDIIAHFNYAPITEASLCRAIQDVGQTGFHFMFNSVGVLHYSWHYNYCNLID